MTVSTVSVSIAVNQITGAALPLGRVNFELTGADIDGGVVAKRATSVTLDANGAATVSLWPNAAGTQGTQYNVTIYDADGGLQYSGKATIPDATCSLHDVLDLAAPGTITTLAAGFVTVTPPTGYTSTNMQDGFEELAAAIDSLEVEAGATNLSYTASPTGGTVASDTGTDATLTLADATNAGLMAPAHFTAVAALATTYQPLDSDLTAIAALTTTTYGRAFLALADAAAARTALALGTAATAATGDFDAAGAAAAAQAASQPLDSDLTAIAALTTTTFGRALLAMADAAALRTAAGLGTAATAATGDFATAAQGATADAAVVANAGITGATKTKITYDAKGLVTAGADATTADIAASTDKNYVTDAQQTVIGNTSGTNTGDQTSIVGITGTIAQFNTAVTDADLATLGANTFTGAQVLSDQSVSRAMFKDCGVTFVDKGNSGTSTQTLDYTDGPHQKVTATGNFTLAVSNLPPSGNLGAILLEAVNFGSQTVTWPTATFIKPDGTTTSSVSTWLAASTGRTAFQTSGTDWIKIWSRDASTLFITWAA